MEVLQFPFERHWMVLLPMISKPSPQNCVPTDSYVVTLGTNNVTCPLKGSGGIPQSENK